MWQLAFFYFVNNLGLVFCLFISLFLKYLVPFRPSGSDADVFLSINHFWDLKKYLYISVQSSVFGIHVTATKGCHNNFYGWVCCEWSYYKGDLVSFITHFKGVGKRRWGCQSNHSRVYHISGGLSSPEVQTHCIKRRNKSRRQEARTKPKDI